MATSTYIQISQYALLEYIYSSEIIPTTKAKTLRIYNNYSNEYQFVNNAIATKTTANTLDYSAIRLGRESTQWGYLDMDTVTPIVQIDPNINLVDVTSKIGPNVKYDRVRLHMLSGYDFPGIDGFILQLNWNEWNINGTGGRNFTPAAQVYFKGEDRFNFSSTPLFVGDRLYDRFLEFALPSLSDVNFDFWNSPNADSSIGYQYTFDNVGFSQESLITATLWEINNTTSDRNGNRYFTTGASYTSTLNSQDLYSSLSAVIQESAEYDYIEYYPTWNGEFLEDYINLLNISGGDWVVVNQLDLYEQLGSTFVRTFSMTSLQDTALNAPATYRPVIRNASLAVSYTVEYVMRLLNKANGQEIIRRATFTSANPKKYGPNIQRINVLEGFRPVRVYNKIVNTSTETIRASVIYSGLNAPLNTSGEKEIVYVNSYYDVNYISVDSATGISGISASVTGEIIYPQGMNIIFITRFDNYVKFKIFTKSPDKGRDIAMNLAGTGMNAKLAFIFDDQSKLYIDPTPDQTAADPGAGELLFKIDDTVATRLLNEKQRDYYIVNQNESGDDVLIYSGKFASIADRTEMVSEIGGALREQVSTLTGRLKILQQQLEEARKNQQSGGGTANQFAEFAQDVEIPGVTGPTGASVKFEIKPEVLFPSEPARDGETIRDLLANGLTGPGITNPVQPQQPPPTTGSVVITSQTDKPASSTGPTGPANTDEWTVKFGSKVVAKLSDDEAKRIELNSEYPYDDGKGGQYYVSSKTDSSKTITISLVKTEGGR